MWNNRVAVPELPKELTEKVTRKEATRTVKRIDTKAMQQVYVMLSEKYGEQSPAVSDWMEYWSHELNALHKYFSKRSVREQVLSFVGIDAKI